MNYRTLVVAAAAVSLPSIASAAFVVQTPGTPRVITFNQAINDTGIGGGRVFAYNTTSNFGIIREGTLDDTGTTALRSQSWSVRGSGLTLGSLPSGAWTLFGDDADGNLSTTSNITVSGMGIARGTGLVGGTADIAVLGAGNTGVLFGQSNAAPFRDNGATLKVRNSTGSAAISLTVGFDAWYGDPDTSFANLTLSYSLDNITYTPVTTLLGTRTTTATFDRTNAAHWSSLNPVSQTIDLASPVADGSHFYVRLESARVGGSGSGGNWLIDNLGVGVVVPEPSALSLLAIGALGLALRRR